LSNLASIRRIWQQAVVQKWISNANKYAALLVNFEKHGDRKAFAAIVLGSILKKLLGAELHKLD
jgi:hypothetical protein